METRVAKIIISQGDVVEQEVELTKRRMTIGRHPHNDIVIAHRAVSGQHAAITVMAGTIEVEDLASTNGTFVNGLRIARHMLADRDVITVARHTISYMAGSLPAAATAALVEIMNGPNVGKKLSLVKPLTTLGSPGMLVVVIGRQEERYFLRHVDGSGVPLVNGAAIGREPHYLSSGDVLELAGTRLQFFVTSHNP